MRMGLCLMLLLFPLAMNAQQGGQLRDSLFMALRTAENDTVRARIYIRLENVLRADEPELALKYAERGLRVVEKMKWGKGLAVYYNDMGTHYSDRGMHSNALEYLLKSLEHSEELSSIRVKTLANIVEVHLKESNDSLAAVYNKQLLPLAEKENLADTKATYFENLAFLETEREKAAVHFQKSLAIRSLEKDTLKWANVLMNLGDVASDYDSKVNYYLRAKDLFDRADPDHYIAISNLSAIAEAYIQLANNDSLLSASKISKTRTELLEEAEEYLNTSVESSKRSHTAQNLMFSYGLLSELKNAQGDYKEALEYAQLNYIMYDSLFSQENKNRMAALGSEKEIALRDKEIELNKINLQNRQRQQYFLLGGIFLFAIIGGLLFYQNRLRRKSNTALLHLNADLDQANKVKARFFAILNHDLRSPVANLIHFLHLQKESPEILDKESKERLESKTINAAENLLVSMEDILLWSKGQMGNFSPTIRQVAVNSLFEDLAKHFESEEKVSIIFEDFGKLKLATDEDYLKTIMRNLTANAIKALSNTPDANIVWKAERKDGLALLSITDNGPGTAEGEFSALYNEESVVGIKSGLGLHLIRDLAKAIHCDISWESEKGKGTVFVLRLGDGETG